MRPIPIALVGDYSPEVAAHRAIERCFELKRARGNPDLAPRWLPTVQIVPGNEQEFEGIHGIWCVPASPYRNTEGALWAIEYARTRSLPFLGTCGGYQHALLEYARNVLGLKDAGHAELDPNTPLPLVNRLACSLVEEAQKIWITGEKLRHIYGGDSGREMYHCRYGLNPAHENLFKGGPLEIVARSETGEPRAFFLKGHPFFVGAQFQPERLGLNGAIHPIVDAFFSACR